VNEPDGGIEPWLVELRAKAPGRLDLDADVILVATLWDLGTTGVTEIDGRLVAGFADRGQAQTAVGQLRSPVLDVTARPMTGADTEQPATPPSPPTTVRFAVGEAVRSISVVAGPTFGHGHHPTTRLALHILGTALNRASDGRHLSDLRVLDVGTGSGVLAVAAARAGAGSVVAVDVDAACESVVATNASNNGVQVEVMTGDIEAAVESPVETRLDQPFDVVVANLLLVEHIAVADTLRRLLAPNGHLVLSGYLIDQADRVLRLHPDLDAEWSLTSGDWMAHLLTGRR
jgi:ribosomal protein L11 methyltransferase